MARFMKNFRLLLRINSQPCALVFLTMLMLCTMQQKGFGQDHSDLWKKRSAYVEAIDADCSLTRTVFIRPRGNEVHGYTFTRSEHELVSMTGDWPRRVAGGVDTTSIACYVRGDELLYAKERIRERYRDGSESILIIEYIFDKGRLVDLVSLGHGKTEDDQWDPEKDILEAYHKIRTAVHSFMEVNRINVAAPGDSLTTYRAYYANKTIKSIRHQGRFNGCGMPVGVDSLFSPSGKLSETVAYENRKGKTDEGCHAGWTITKTIRYYPDGKMKSLAHQRSAYEGLPCDCGSWVDYNQRGVRTKERNMGDCDSQVACD